MIELIFSSSLQELAFGNALFSIWVEDDVILQVNSRQTSFQRNNQHSKRPFSVDFIKENVFKVYRALAEKHNK